MIGGRWESAAPGLRVSECCSGDVLQLRFAGELDIATAPVAAQILAEAAGWSCTVAVDLSG